MNWQQLLGGIIVIIGSALGFWGSYIQGRESSIAQKNQENFFDEQRKINKPNVVPVSIEQKDSRAILKIRNTGLSQAKNISIMFLGNSTPSAISSNLILKIPELHGNTEWTPTIDLLYGINLILKHSTSKTKLNGDVEKFRKGEMSFRANFKIKYEYDSHIVESEEYFIIFNKDGIIYLGL